MTVIILTFPVRRTPALSCVWIETGNPTQPLACKWIASDQAESGPRPGSAVASLLCQLCA